MKQSNKITFIKPGNIITFLPTKSLPSQFAIHTVQMVGANVSIKNIFGATLNFESMDALLELIDWAWIKKCRKY